MIFSDATRFVKNRSQELGFEFCGIAKAEQLDADARRLERWLQNGMHGTMRYMENHFDLRTDPRKLVPGARSVITLLLNYFPKEKQPDNQPKISTYAYGEDYHGVIKQKLHLLLESMTEKIGAIHGRGFVDSAPVLERSWAEKSGLGWIGKNGNLINKKQGSFFFIATLITDLELEYDPPMTTDYCGTCQRCIEACPTAAILPDRVIDGSRCISYFTIELKDALIPSEMKGKFDNWMFGCDTCQDVCPWNRFSKPTKEKAFTPIREIFDFGIEDWNELTAESFKKIFKHSPLQRAKIDGIRRNITFLQSDIGSKTEG